jgi:hypothetical protein
VERGHQAQCCVDAADATGFLYFPVFLIPTKKKKRDTAFFRALNEIRVGKVSDESLALLNSRVGQKVEEQVAGDGQSGIFATRLRARRAGVAESNAALLAALPRGGGVLFDRRTKARARCWTRWLLLPSCVSSLARRCAALSWGRHCLIVICFLSVRLFCR